MRRMVGPGKWEELGPGSAVNGTNFGHSPAMGARGIGHMIPGATGGIMLQNRSVSPERAAKLKRG